MVGEKIGQLSKTMMFLNMLVSHIHVFFFQNIRFSKKGMMMQIYAHVFLPGVLCSTSKFPSSRSGLCHEPVLLHDLNVRIYVPDMPDEYFKLPYPSAKSDMLRYGVLYHHGGIYMDADLLAQVSAAINQWHLNKPWESYMTCVPTRITSCPWSHFSKSQV